MIDDLRAIAIFAEAIKQGSFRRAAQVLGLSPSVVSYHISQLEQKVGTALIYRSTRKLSLSHDGELLYRHALDMLRAVEIGIGEVSAGGNDPTGRLKLTMPAALARAPINRLLAEFSQRNPRVEMNIRYTDNRQDIIAEGFDLAIRAGEMPDSALLSKRIGSVERKLVCSPQYLEGRLVPECPQDISGWNWIKLAMLPNHRRLQRRREAPVEIVFASNLSVNSVDAMTQLCLCGAGVATPPDYLVEEALERGNLVELLPEWRVETMPVYACWPANVSDSSVTRQLVDHLGTGVNDR